MIQENCLFRLTTDYEDLKAGNLLLKGGDADPDFTEEEGFEFFDMTKELADGYGVSYSYYNVPHEILTPANKEDYDTVNKFFDDANARWSSYQELPRFQKK